MATKNYSVSPEDMRFLSAESIERLIEVAPDFLFAFSPDTLRQACASSKKVLYALDECFSAKCQRVNDDAAILFDRPGYLRQLTDREWFKRMRAICKDCLIGEPVPTDPDEAGFAAYELEMAPRRAALAARLKAKQEAAMASLAAKQSREAVHRKSEEMNTAPQALAEAGQVDKQSGADARNRPAEKESEHGSSSETEIFLRTTLYLGQLNISNLLTGSRLVSIGTDTRQCWESKNPLLVTKISGIEAGTTAIQYVGEELHVGDIETWATAIHFGAKSPLETRVPLVEREMLKALHRGDSGPNYKTLREQIRRLQNAKLVVLTTHRPTILAVSAAMPEDMGVQEALKSGRLELVIPLLGGSSNGTKAHQRGTLHVTIPKDVRALFGKGLSSWFAAHGYYQLRNPTARRLFLLYGRHKDPWPFTRDELREYLGSTMTRDSDFKKILERAFREMVKTGFLATMPTYIRSERRRNVEAYAVTFGNLKSKTNEATGTS